MKRLLVLLIAIVVIFLALMLAMAQPAGAQQGTPPPTATVQPQNPADKASVEAASWDAVQQAAINQAQGAANQAIAAAQQALAAAAKAQLAYEKEHEARVAVQNALMNQAVDSAHQAQLAAVQAIELGREATQSASLARMQSDLALRNVATLKAGLKDTAAQRDAARADAANWQEKARQADLDRTALAGALKAEQDQKDLYGKVAIGALALLGVVLAYVAFVLAKLLRALRVKPTDRVVVLNERGRVMAQIEGIP